MRFVSLIRYAALTLLLLPLWGNAATIAAGGSHTCALTAAGGVQCWGRNTEGQLGDGTSTQRLTPVVVSGLSSGVQAIAAGDKHTCALTTVGGVQCWGYNNAGQLGDGTSTQRLTPVAVSGLSSGVQAIGAGQSHTCALMTTGGVKCWGVNTYGQMGDGTTTLRVTPVAVSGLSSGVQAISTGGYHTCALTTTGAVQCWGYNVNGQLGDGSTTNRLTSVAVSGLSSGVQTIAAGGQHTCALLSSGSVQCWGGNWYGTLGNGTASSSNIPLTVSGLSGGAQSIAAGQSHTCALLPVGGVQCWGYNASGQVGDGTTTNSLTPAAVYGLNGGVQSVATGYNHSCIMKTSGSVQCWGSNTNGQLGDGTITNRLTPVLAVKGAQSITVTTAAPAIGIVGADFSVAASSSSGLPVTITASGGCSISGNTVTITSAVPFCTVTYTQAGNTEYLAAVVTSVTSVDTDGDGIPDATDMDNDNDGVLNNDDVFPLDASEWLDSDYDGIGNNAETDDDNDTVLDDEDNCPLRANTNQLDSNGNGKGDACEPSALAAGGSHTCALTAAGGVQCWGANGNGQLGDGTTTNRLTPVAVSGLSSGVRTIAAGDSHSCALTTAGGVQCWGYNWNGQLGDGTTTNRLTPVAVSGLSSGVQSIAAAGLQTCALMTTGGVQCWGVNTYGQLGDGTTTQRLTPVVVSGLSGVQAIAAGGYHTCAQTAAGGVQCWGYNVNGQLGDGSTTNRLTSVAVSGLSSGVQTIAAGGQHTCALLTSGSVQCWGGNWNGTLGNGTTSSSNIPLTVSGLSGGAQNIAAGQSHTCALMTTGGVQCWGYNNKGQVGDGTTTNRLVATAVSGLNSGAQNIAAGQSHSCAKMASGSLQCWGFNASGQLGDATIVDRLTPVGLAQITLAQNITVTTAAPALGVIGAGFPVAASSSSGLPVTITVSGGCSISGNTVTIISATPPCTVTYTQDGNSNYSAAPVVTSVTSVPMEQPSIATGLEHTCALTKAGGVQCWGNNKYGQLGDGTSRTSYVPIPVSGLSSGVQAIATGGSHTCALTTTGAVKCWGYNYYGQLGDGTTTNRLTPVTVSGLSSGVQAIATGGSHTCALTTAGAVRCWGSNNSREIGDGTTTNRLMPVPVSGLSSGVIAINGNGSGTNTCVLTMAGAVKCWGDNTNGQLGDGSTTQSLIPVTVSGLSGSVQAIAVGGTHNCVLMSTGGVQCWGVNTYGQLGDGTTTQRLAPVAVSGLSGGVLAITAGSYHTCVHTAAGGVQCWGYNNKGQLGDGTVTNRLTPVAVNGLSSGVQAIAAGWLYTCALTTADGVWCWGSNNLGQLGDGTWTQHLTPVITYGMAQIFTVDTQALGVIGVGFPVAASSNTGLPVTITVSGGCSLSGNTVTITSATPFCTVTFSAAGNAEYAATTVTSITSVDTDGDGTPNAIDTDDDNDGVLDDDDVFSLDTSEWLDSDYDGIGNNADTDDDNDTVLDGNDNCPLRANPNQADSNANGKGDTCEPSALAAGDSHTCALTAAGGVQCWGDNQYGQLGDGSTTNRLTPVAVSGLSSGVQAIAAGSSHTCALTAAGGVQCWGDNSGGQLGDGTAANSLTPVIVFGLSSGVQMIAAGRFFTCALTVAGGVKCWGYNDKGQLGDGTWASGWVPAAVSGLSSGVQAIGAGSAHACAVKAVGSVWCWGQNAGGELGNGTVTPLVRLPAAVTGLGSDIQQITAGWAHTCALAVTGGVKCWGDNGYDQLGDGSTTQRLTPVAVSGLSSGVQAMATGYQHNCALKSAGDMKCWGYNDKGQLGDGTTTSRWTPVTVNNLNNVVAMAAGYSHTCALTAAGRVQCWGNNANGQLGDGSTTQRLIPGDVLRDGDGVLDAADAFPLNPAESIDTDHDGIGNNADTDDDGDGVPDSFDSTPLGQPLSLDGSYQGSSIQESAAPL